MMLSYDTKQLAQAIEDLHNARVNEKTAIARRKRAQKTVLQCEKNVLQHNVHTWVSRFEWVPFLDDAQTPYLRSDLSDRNNREWFENLSGQVGRGEETSNWGRLSHLAKVDNCIVTYSPGFLELRSVPVGALVEAQNNIQHVANMLSLKVVDSTHA